MFFSSASFLANGEATILLFNTEGAGAAPFGSCATGALAGAGGATDVLGVGAETSFFIGSGDNVHSVGFAVQ